MNKSKRINGREALSRIAYYNCLMLSPDETKLGYCDEKKERYYLSHGLATQVNGYETRAIKLNFEPKSKTSEEEFLFPRENACVVCGRTENLTKHHIVPYNYRLNFPVEIKSKNSYDIIALCVDHHNEYEQKANKFKKDLAKEFKVDSKENVDEKVKIQKRIRGLANTLVFHRDVIPKDNAEKLFAQLQSLLGKIPTQSELELLCIKENRKRQSNDHGRLICEKLKGFEGINDFIIRWRQHFLKVMNPQHMPKDWKVDRKFPTRKEPHQ
jgi:hypothetical protein